MPPEAEGRSAFDARRALALNIRWRLSLDHMLTTRDRWPRHGGGVTALTIKLETVRAINYGVSWGSPLPALRGVNPVCQLEHP